MTTRSFIACITILGFITQPFVLLAQTSADWTAVTALDRGTEVRVETKTGKKVGGNMDSVSADKISILANGLTEEISISAIKKVYKVGKGSRGPGVAIGAAAGAGVGAAIGGGLLAGTGGSDDTAGVLAPFIAVGAGLGALAGALIPRKKRTLIYEAR